MQNKIGYTFTLIRFSSGTGTGRGTGTYSGRARKVILLYTRRTMTMKFYKFWDRQPALLYGLAMLLGVYGSWITLFPLLILLGSALPNFTRCTLAFLLAIGMYGYVTTTYDFPSQDISGAAFFKIEDISIHTTHFGKQWQYRGTINSEAKQYKNVECVVSFPCNKEIIRPRADCLYKIEGTLKQGFGGRYIFQLDKKAPWIPLEPFAAIPEYRFAAKKEVEAYIKSHISHVRAATFLSAIATGDFDDRAMSHEFGRFGLQHIMAISGFHFALIAGCLALLLRNVLTVRRMSLFVILFLSCYLMLLGNSPSVIRAWIGILIALGSAWMERRSFGLNSLGVALMIILILDPLSALKIGFQFSFAVTAAILMFYPLCLRGIDLLLVKRRLSDVIEMHLWDQHGYFILTYFRKALALGIAVNIVAIPLTLFLFQKFPLLSLGFNLFFPLFISLSLFLLLVGFLFIWIPPMAGVIHAINSSYTQWVLDFTYFFPRSLDTSFHVEAFPVAVLVLYLTLAFAVGAWGLLWSERRKGLIQ